MSVRRATPPGHRHNAAREIRHNERRPCRMPGLGRLLRRPGLESTARASRTAHSPVRRIAFAERRSPRSERHCSGSPRCRSPGSDRWHYRQRPARRGRAWRGRAATLVRSLGPPRSLDSQAASVGCPDSRRPHLRGSRRSPSGGGRRVRPKRADARRSEPARAWTACAHVVLDRSSSVQQPRARSALTPLSTSS